MNSCPSISPNRTVRSTDCGSGAVAADGVEERWSGLAAAGLPGVCLGWAPVTADTTEARFDLRLLQAARPKRLREFAAGRRAVRIALERLGEPAAAPIPRALSGAPIWPAGVCGSISHCSDRAVAAVARHADHLTLGIDIEHRDAVRAELWDVVFRDSEVGMLAALDEVAATRRATAMFSLKEAFYKLQHALCGSWLDYRDAEGWCDAGGAFHLRVVSGNPEQAAIAARTRCRVTWGDAHVLTLCSLEPER